ncbi:MAG: cyclic nucleotide-binding domain-containing protein [Acidobacteria bacterium]|nr:cyclic nucleotide-binding domain-containing protein [Acidobacteriota bacterium]
MVLKKLFGGSKKELAEEDYTIEDLFVLERYEEAASRLKDRLKGYPQDLHAHLRLADVYIQLRQLPQAVEEYIYVAEEYADDGFFDKGLALLFKVQKLVTMDENLPLKIEKIRARKRIEALREQALEGLREGMGGGRGGTSALELQGMWGQLLRSKVVQMLTGDQLKRLFSAMTLQPIEEGHVLAERNSDQQELFLIVRGEVEASASVGAGPPVQIRLFGPGDVVGEASVLERKPWPASYVAVSDVRVLRLTREGLEKAMVGSDDPRAIIGALREQQHDREVVEAILKLAQ